MVSLAVVAVVVFRDYREERAFLRGRPIIDTRKVASFAPEWSAGRAGGAIAPSSAGVNFGLAGSRAH